jgi:hypothetical protein
MNANGLYSGLELGAVNGVYNGVNSGVGNGAISNETNLLNIPILDRFPNAAAAYSLRKLSVNYFGAAIRVRRSSDNAEQDIGFDINGNLNETQLRLFVGSGDGFITIWYSQTGNNNLTQSTLTRQPRIVSAGVVDKQNGKPCVFYDGNDNLFTASDITHTDYTVFSAVYFRSTITDANSIGTLYRSNDTSNILTFGGNVTASFTNERIVLYNAESGVKGFAYTDANIAIGSYVYAINYTYLNTLEIRQNSIPLVLQNVTFTVANYPKSFRNLGGGTTTTDGTFASNVFEFILYTTSQASNTTAIQSNINSYYKIY